MSEPNLLLSGSIQYTPYTHFPTEIMRKLQDILEEVRDIDDCENPETILDWNHTTHDEQGLLIKNSAIILYRDGGDWGGESDEEEGHYEGIGILFCRSDITKTGKEYKVHIPEEKDQDILLKHTEEVFGSLRKCETEHLFKIQEYLLSIVEDDSKWIDINQLIVRLFG